MSFTSLAAVCPSPLAGPDYLDAVPMHRDEVKVHIGLGLGLPSGVLHNSFGVSKSVGLGIYIDFENWDGLLASAVPNADHSSGASFTWDEQPSPSVSFMSEEDILLSPPMLGTRLTRPAPPQDSFWDEYAPFRTPSPSLLFASSSGYPTPPPDESTLELSVSMLQSGFTLPSTESIASGLNLLSLDDEELAAYAPSPAALRPDAGVGLGLSLAGLSGPELVCMVHAHGFRGHDLGEGEVFSSPTLPHLSQSYHELVRVTQPTSRSALVGLGIGIEGWSESPRVEEDVDDVLENGESSASPDSVEVQPSLGFDAPFWVRFNAMLYGDWPSPNQS